MERQIESKDLYIRPLNESDLDRTHEWMHRPDINKKIGVKIPFTKDEQIKWFNQLQNDNTKVVFAVCRKESGTHIGNISIDNIDLRHKNARFSIFIADQNNRGKGFGKEALSLIEDYAFNVLNLHKIWCKTDADDPQVIRFYKNSGYQIEGTLKEHEYKEPHFIDKILFAKIT
ncbi:MAG: GNAT family N-acetyltransferase [bacterium]